MVDEAVFPGDAVGLAGPPDDTDSPGVGVDLSRRRAPPGSHRHPQEGEQRP